MKTNFTNFAVPWHEPFEFWKFCQVYFYFKIINLIVKVESNCYSTFSCKANSLMCYFAHFAMISTSHRSSERPTTFDINKRRTFNLSHLSLLSYNISFLLGFLLGVGEIIKRSHLCHNFEVDLRIFNGRWRFTKQICSFIISCIPRHGRVLSASEK